MTTADLISGFVDNANVFADMYRANMRSSMFTAFLTLSGFLLSAKTFIVVNMKKEVYDNPAYRDNFNTQKKLKPDMSLYGPLQTLSRRLTINVASSLIASILQFSVGFIHHWAAAAICVASAIVVIIMLFVSLYQIHNNLNNMFVWLNLSANTEAKTR